MSSHFDRTLNALTLQGHTTMQTEARLMIRLTPGSISADWRRQQLNEVHGGPESLLAWLETQLGLSGPMARQADRVTEFAGVLDSIGNAVFSQSLAVDRWATATDLLARYDFLGLSGWAGAGDEHLPPLVQDLARALTGRPLRFPGEAERLKRVLRALETGQQLPPHRCHLHDAVESWPKLWQEVLAKLTLAPCPDVPLASPQGSSLQMAQLTCRGQKVEKIYLDTTLRYVHTRSASAAVELIGAVFSTEPEKLSQSVIYCEDDDLALRLDACLSRLGLPTSGAAAWSRSHPVLQVLPLSLALCWDPVDPQVLLDFLTLPVIPLPRRVAANLASALTKEPGLGSAEWEMAMEEVCSQSEDPEGKHRELIDHWLHCPRTERGSEISSQQVRQRAGMVAQWAQGRASILASEGESTPSLREAFLVAAGQASLLGELAQSQGTALSEPQLARLLEESLASGVQAMSHIQAEGGPIRVRSLAEIDGPVDRLIWLGLGTGDAAGCPWSTNQLEQLRQAGIDVDDGSRKLAALRSAEVRGLGNVRESALAIMLPQDGEKRWHPVWLAISSAIKERILDDPPIFEDLLAEGQVNELSPFTFSYHEVEVVASQPPRPVWDIPSELLHDRGSASATELNDRLACPLKWTFTYQARLRPSRLAQLPRDFQLKGTFCHRILERVFGAGGDLPTVAEAVSSVARAFEERLPLDAAPLAQPNKYFERQQLKNALEHATRVLIGTLANGGYRIIGLEVALSGNAFGKNLSGSIDCVAQREDGEEAIIDFKFGGRKKYYSLIQDGKAIQLATYAYGRSIESGNFPGIAYLVLADGLLYTPSGSPVHGDGHRALIQAESIETVWNRFSQAIEAADQWMTGDSSIPARPLQDPSHWPEGADMVLDPRPKSDQQQEVCKYCDFQGICGIQEIT